MSYTCTLTQKVKDKAIEFGFADVGVTSVAPFDTYKQEFLSRDNYNFFIREGDEGLVQGCDPQKAFPGCKSIISLVYNYGDIDYPPELLQHVGRAYLGRCYGAPADTVNGQRVALFKDYLHNLGIKTYDPKGYLQVPDRAVAARAGLIIYGKNNFAYAQGCGSFIILTSIVTDAELETVDMEPYSPCPPDCQICINACPTKAMDTNGHLDPTRCILYNNFTHDDLHTADLREEIGLRIHGCDACQEACPMNHDILAAHKQKDKFLDELAERFDLVKILNLDDEYYEAVVKPIMFNYIRDLDLFRRNAAIAMGNSGDRAYIESLEAALPNATGDVRDAIEWAVDRLQS